MAKKRAYEDSWRFVRDHSAGGHGYTHIVERANGEGGQYVAKVLKDQGNPERRARMSIEAFALSQLEHPRIPRLVETNGDKHTDRSVLLYMISEYIDGPPMSKLTEPVAVRDACQCMEGIFDAVAYCHGRGILHRDLKPDNVILRGGNVSDPVVLDFGQAFNANSADGFETPSNQPLGNGRMQLPELQTSGADKHNELSDVAFCVGLLYFLLTNRYAEALRVDGKQPHERDPARVILAKLPSVQLRQLERIFGNGFAIDTGDRWQSLGELRRQVARLIDPALDAERIPLKDRLTTIKASMDRDTEHSARLKFSALTQDFNRLMIDIQSTLHDALGDRVHIGGGMEAHDPSIGQVAFALTLVHQQWSQHPVRVRLAMHRHGSQVSLAGLTGPPPSLFGGQASVNATGEELTRLSMSDVQLLNLLRDKAELFVAESVDDWRRNLPASA